MNTKPETKNIATISMKQAVDRLSQEVRLVDFNTIDDAKLMHRHARWIRGGKKLESSRLYYCRLISTMTAGMLEGDDGLLIATWVGQNQDRFADLGI